MNISVKAVVRIFDEIDLEILNHAISPENRTMPEENGTVSSSIIGNEFVTDIEGKMNVGKLINTIDDIIKTAILAKNVVNASDDTTI